MGIFPACSAAIRARSLSVAITSCPASARQLPDTSPTYPQPITANFTLVLPLERNRSVLRVLYRANDSRRFPRPKKASFAIQLPQKHVPGRNSFDAWDRLKEWQ